MKKWPGLAYLILLTVSAQAQTRVLDSLQAIVARHTRDTIEVLALDNISGEYMRKDLPKAIHYSHLALTLAKTLKYNNGISRAYATLIPMHQNTGHLDSAQYFVT